MRVGFFTYGIYGNRMTGIARYAVELTRALKKIRPSAELILLNPYPNTEHTWYSEFPNYPLPHLKKLPVVATLGNLELHQAAKKLNLDILHDPCGIAPFLAPKDNYRRVTTIHDALPVVYPRTQPFFTRLVFRLLVARAGKTSDAIFTVSQTSADDLRRYYNFPSSKVYVTPNGVNPAQFSAGENLNKTLRKYGIKIPYFLYVGALNPRKNINRVIEAFLLLRKQEPEVSLVIVGPPSWGARHELRTVLNSAGLENGIVFTNFLSDEHLHLIYRGAYGLVFPSLYEGFGLPVLEAMSFGTPVITSNVSALPEVAGDAALLVDPCSTYAIYEGMLRLLKDSSLRGELCRKGLARSRLFTWEKTAEATFEIYSRMLSC